MVMVTLSSVHEEVHQRTSEEQEIRESAQHMSRVLCDEEEPGDGQEPEERDLPARVHSRRVLDPISRRWLVHERTRYLAIFASACAMSWCAGPPG
jgi:hypothetical protein